MKREKAPPAQVKARLQTLLQLAIVIGRREGLVGNNGSSSKCVTKEEGDANQGCVERHQAAEAR